MVRAPREVGGPGAYREGPDDQATCRTPAAGLVLSGCTTAGQNAAVGAAAGGIIGGAAGGVITRNASGVYVGAAIGAVSGAILAANNTKPAGWCTFRDKNTGQLFYARCP